MGRCGRKAALLGGELTILALGVTSKAVAEKMHPRVSVWPLLAKIRYRKRCCSLAKKIRKEEGDWVGRGFI